MKAWEDRWSAGEGEKGGGTSRRYVSIMFGTIQALFCQEGSQALVEACRVFGLAFPEGEGLVAEVMEARRLAASRFLLRWSLLSQ